LAESHIQTIDFSMCCNLEAVGQQCLSGSAVRAIDLSSCSKLQSLDDYFLRDTKKLRSVILPSSLKRLGDFFLRNSDIETIDLSMCCNLEAVGRQCLSGSAVTSIDLSSCSKLQELGEYFLSDTKNLRSVILPSSLKRRGSYLLKWSKVE
jgi:phosphoribosylaminoimidazole-succinocarboxamide synthase